MLPCGDRDNCDETKHEQTAHTDHEKSYETCSPICACNCCASHFVMKYSQVITDHISEINTIYTAHQESETSAAIIPIWQPPKLA